MKKVIPALFFCLLAVIGGLCWVVLGNPYYAASDRNEGDLLLPLAAETEEIFLQSESYRLKMTEEKGVWLADGYYADNIRAQSYLQALRSAVIVGKKEVSGKELAKNILSVKTFCRRQPEPIFIVSRFSLLPALRRKGRKIFPVT